MLPGTYDGAGTLAISVSGVVLRGSGSAEDGTNLRVAGPPHRLLDISGTGTWEPAGPGHALTDAYVPSGLDSFHVSPASELAPGDTVLGQRPVTGAWIRFMGMDALSRDGKPQTWITPGAVINADRTIRTPVGVTGPNVVLRFRSDEAGVAPHQRWATGLLVDSSEFSTGTERRPNLAFSNREHAGSGHGWSVGWAVAWNVKADCRSATDWVTPPSQPWDTTARPGGSRSGRGAGGT